MNKYKQYLLSKEWLEIRLDIIQTRKCCERCGSKQRLQVHHTTYKNLFNEEPEDLELLCSGCHMSEHGLDKNGKKKLTLAQKVCIKKKKTKNKKRKQSNTKPKKLKLNVKR